MFLQTIQGSKEKNCGASNNLEKLTYFKSSRGAITMASPDKTVIIEFVKVGAYVKVSAIDPTTRVEVSIVGDPSVSQATLERTAVQKLKYVLNKRDKRD